MWSFSAFVNKLLNLEEDGKKNSDCSLSSSCSLKFSLNDGMDQDMLLPRSRFIEVPHVNQLYNWDCGLACVLMVLQTIGINHCSLHSLEDLCGTRRMQTSLAIALRVHTGSTKERKIIGVCAMTDESLSIWTVDLAYLLQSFSVIFSYFTVTLGANPNFSVETFYKDHLQHDLVRVDLLFQKAFKDGIRIECRSFSQEEVSLLMLSGRYIAIALVDHCKLSQSLREDIHISDFCGSNIGYTGHYIVICGYDADEDEFEIRDPASSRKYQKISSKHLDEARKSFGTDEDLLLISLNQIYNKEEFSLFPADHVNKDV